MNPIKENLKRVRENIARAADKAGRNPAEINLVCVTKSVGIPEIRELFQLGQRFIGENRVQDARRKIAEIPSLGIEWHLIGHLQTNKVKLALDLFQYFHAVDSLRLAEEISKRAEALEIRVPLLIEVNVSGEGSKFGCPVEGTADCLGVYDLASQVSRLPGLDLQGLMTMAPFDQHENVVRPVFRRLREIRDEINSRSLTPKPLLELSMGMSGDYPIAVEEGATYVRIGTALFE